MSYLVKNISGRIQTMPKVEEVASRSLDNWAIGMIDTVVGSVINLYRAHPTVFQILSGPGKSMSVGSAATGVTSVDSETGLNRTVLTLVNASVATVDAGAAGAHGTMPLYTFPEGLIAILAATMNLTIARVGTGLTTTSAIVAAIGSVVAATDNATLTSTEADILPSTASTLTAGAGVTKGKTTAVAVLDGTTTPVVARLNFATPDAGSTATDALLVNGTVTLLWSNAGDY